MDAHALYLRRLLRVAGLALGLLAAFNVFADPFGMWRRLHLPHLHKDPEPWSRVSAAERIARGCQVVLLGSSRTMHGYGPEIPKWGNREVCNGALGGTSIHEIRDVFDWVLKQPPVRYVILFADFQLFYDARGVNGDFAQSRFNADRTRLTYYLWGATSLDATHASLVQYGLEEGYKLPGTQLRADKVELYRFIKNPHLYTGWTGDEETIQVLDSMLDDAQRRGIRMMLVIPSVHAMLLQTEYETGRWERALEWRKRLVELLAARRGREVELWDFCTFHEASMSAMQLHRDDPPSPWFVDISHQSGQLGWATMQRIVEATEGGDTPWEETFGVKLTPENIDAHLARLEADRVRYVEAHPEQLAWLEAAKAEIDTWPAPDEDAAKADLGGTDLVLPEDEP
ncbi:MAG TPA: hypothetical protein PKA64_13000 [Myxococcota bacterium]|nr:hypothetical protein [Myxococcota bacterium]